MPISIVIFDFGSTLVRTSGSYPERARRFLLSRVAASHSRKETEFAEFDEKVFQDMLERREHSGLDFELTQYFNLLQACLGIRFEGDLDELICECWFRQYEPQLEDGAEECLRHLRRKGARLGLLSNTVLSRGSVELALKRFGVLDLFDAVICSSEVAYRKPDVLIFRAMLGLLNAKPHQSVMVGDSLQDDVAGAAALGMTTVWYNPQGLDAGGVGADYIVSDLRSVPAVLGMG